jgi:uncharacterized protein (TIGR02246 family)
MAPNNTPSVLVDDETAVREVLQNMVAAWTANDAAAFAALYTENASVVTPGTYVQGRDDIRSGMAAGFAGPLKGSKSIDTQESVRIIGDAAVVVSLSGILMAGEDELPAERLRRATWVLSRQGGGEWLVESYHNCSANTPA